MPSLGLSLGLGGVRVLGAAGGPTYDPDALAWFEAVEGAGSVFATGAKDAYNNFFVSQKANGNLEAFNNGMMLFYVGFTGLNGCFVPVRSRGGTLPTNVSFVSGQKFSDGLQGGGTARIDTNLGFLSGQQNSHCLGSFVTGIETGASGVRPDMGNGAYFVSGGSAIGVDLSVSVVRYWSSAGNTVLTIAANTGARFLNRTSSANFSYFSRTTSELQARDSETIRTANLLFYSTPGQIPSSSRYAAQFFGDALPDPEAFRTALNTLMTALGVSY